jgi:hypothetical protein
MKTVVIVAALVVCLAITIAWALYAWNSIDVDMPAHGYIAMTLGIVFSLLVGCGLMALVFFSSRRGYDDPPNFDQ